MSRPVAALPLLFAAMALTTVALRRLGVSAGAAVDLFGAVFALAALVLAARLLQRK